jgi:hypothetical protein
VGFTVLFGRDPEFNAVTGFVDRIDFYDRHAHVEISARRCLGTCWFDNIIVRFAGHYHTQLWHLGPLSYRLSALPGTSGALRNSALHSLSENPLENRTFAVDLTMEI